MNPVLTILPNGINGGMPSPTGNRKPPKRGVVSGWSVGSARRNMKFLQSVRADQLSNNGFAFTFTIRDIPKTSGEWADLRLALCKHLMTLGCECLHWVTEWQQRGAPHLHGVCYFPSYTNSYLAAESAVAFWIKKTSYLGTQKRSQHISAISDAVGWFQYMAKHASRGMHHYQREKGSLPPEWDKTGRLWGKRGDWPCEEEKGQLLRHQWFIFRRLVLKFSLSQAVTELRNAEKFGDEFAIKKARRRVRFCKRSRILGKRATSEVRGLNEWIPRDLSEQILAFALTQMKNGGLGAKAIAMMELRKFEREENEFYREENIKSLRDSFDTDDDSLHGGGS